MTILTAKARQMIEYGIADFGDHHQRKIWYSWEQANPAVRGPGQSWETATGKLPYEVVATALYVLEHVARGKRRQLENAGLTEDEVADLDNDLGYIKSLQRFLLDGVAAPVS
jgi:hypothetical protein